MKREENPGSGLVLLAVGGLVAFWAIKRLKATFQSAMEARMNAVVKQNTVPK